MEERTPSLPNNQALAEQRMRSLKKTLQKDPELHQWHTETINGYLEKGYASVREEGEESINFLPHFAVKAKRKKKRVFAACTEYNGTSLDDALLQRPDYLNTLTGVITRFRLGAYAFQEDIKGTFHQVRVIP